MTEPHRTHETDAYLEDLAAFIQASPSSYHAAAEAGRRLESAGFVWLDEAAEWPSRKDATADAVEPASAGQRRRSSRRRDGAGRYYVIRDGAVVAWVQPATANSTTPYRIVGAHTDSPGFALKPLPATESHGWLQAGVEIYGGPLLNSWLDRELELAGRVVSRQGDERLVRSGPLLRIPQLAIHLDRSVNDEGLKLDRQRHLVPLFGAEASDEDASTGRDQILELLARLADVDEIAGFDVRLADTQPPARFGLSGELFASGRLDNLVSVHAGVRAITDAALSGAQHVSVLAAFDHEELGSASRSGASGPLLDDVLARVAHGLGGGPMELRRSLAASWCLSADAGHAVHPNYAERHDPVVRPRPGRGPLLKINANQRYATDAAGAAEWARVCSRAGVEFQHFVSNNSVPCGSTIGPLTSTRLGIRTIDAGVPLLSMHSARELCHVDDVAAFAAAVAAFLS